MSEQDPIGRNESPDTPPVVGSNSSLFLDGNLIWHNPEGIGHVFIKIRKQMYEELLASQIERGLGIEDRMIETEGIVTETGWFTGNFDALYNVTRPNRLTEEER